MAQTSFAAVDTMIRQIERTTLATLHATQALSNAIKQGLREEADPHVLAGALVDGIATTLIAGIPEDCRAGVAHDLLALLYARFDALNVFPEDDEPNYP
ncbi:hypothetical protein [Rhodopila sp.]|jgi:hypothetical protein|uniref:hypothetical protein n=1 Tax=Rhodopila sp. TaxID=2480087 RepID=UPI002BA85949|nr:hypothetical protein [Rhodopila sp.]HVZ09937.1 hypothetical protein [Rhodopila sp.]